MATNDRRLYSAGTSSDLFLLLGAYWYILVHCFHRTFPSCMQCSTSLWLVCSSVSKTLVAHIIRRFRIIVTNRIISNIHMIPISSSWTIFHAWFMASLVTIKEGTSIYKKQIQSLTVSVATHRWLSVHKHYGDHLYFPIGNTLCKIIMQSQSFYLSLLSTTITIVGPYRRFVWTLLHSADHKLLSRLNLNSYLRGILLCSFPMSPIAKSKFVYGGIDYLIINWMLH